jgi:hypothetical protein
MPRITRFRQNPPGRPIPMAVQPITPSAGQVGDARDAGSHRAARRIAMIAKTFFLT